MGSWLSHRNAAQIQGKSIGTPVASDDGKVPQYSSAGSSIGWATGTSGTVVRSLSAGTGISLSGTSGAVTVTSTAGFTGGNVAGSTTFGDAVQITAISTGTVVKASTAGVLSNAANVQDIAYLALTGGNVTGAITVGDSLGATIGTTGDINMGLTSGNTIGNSTGTSIKAKLLGYNGYTPANRAGDTFTGTVTIPANVALNMESQGTGEALSVQWQMYNVSAATSAGDKYAPSSKIFSAGWKTAATAGSQFMALGFVLAPEQGVTNPIGVYKWYYATNTSVPAEANELMRLEWGDRLGVVFNDTGADQDFRVEGDTVDTVVFVDAGTDAVILGGTAGTGNVGFFQAAGATQGAHIADPTITFTDDVAYADGDTTGYPNLGSLTGSDTVSIAQLASNLKMLVAAFNKLKLDVAALRNATTAGFAQMESYGLHKSS